jgi:hypothetical protein
LDIFEAEMSSWELLGVSVIGTRGVSPRDEAVIREYIKRQKQEDNRLEQMNLWR